MEFEAVDEGIVGKIVVPEGTEGVKVNDLIAVLLEEGESADAIGAAPRRGSRRAPAAAAPAPAAAPRRRRPPRQPPPAAGADRAGRVFASPLARRIAAEKGLDLAAIKGSGPNGRIVKADVESRASRGAPRRSRPPREAAAPQPRRRPLPRPMPRR